MWKLRHPLNQDVDDILTDTSSFNSDKMSASHSLDSALDLLELEEDHPSLDSTGGSIVSMKYKSHVTVAKQKQNKLKPLLKPKFPPISFTFVTFIDSTFTIHQLPALSHEPQQQR